MRTRAHNVHGAAEDGRVPHARCYFEHTSGAFRHPSRKQVYPNAYLTFAAVCFHFPAHAGGQCVENDMSLWLYPLPSPGLMKTPSHFGQLKFYHCDSA